MTDPTDPPRTPTATAPEIVPRSGWLSETSLVWIVPLVALVVALAMAWQTLSSRGPLIEITFSNAEGVVENETQLRFRDVAVGQVEQIRFGDDLRNVIVGVRLDQDIALFVDADAQFWIVQPEISSQGVSGLGTLLGGVYLEGTWDSAAGAPETQFTGLDFRPLITGAEEGVEFVLSAPRGGSINAGAPIIYKGVNVGLIDRPVLSEDGTAVTARAFVQAPYDRLITTGARFWGASGVSVSFGTAGLDLEIANLTALVQGGIAFDTLSAGGEAIEDGHVFFVHASRDAAGSPGAVQDLGPQVPFSALFEGSIEGLNVGAPVEYRGLRIGTVAATGGQVSPMGAEAALLLRVDLSIQPTRLGLSEDDVADRTRGVMERLVAEGYRARLVSEGLLGASLKVQLSLVEDALPAAIGVDDEGRLLLPTAPPDISDPVNTARTAVARLNALPIELMVERVGDLLDNVNRLIASDGVRDAPEAVTGLVQDLRGIVGAPETQQATANAAASLETLNTILARFEEGAAIENLLSALERSDAIAASVQRTVDELPALADRIGTLAAEAAGLPLEQLLAEVQGLVAVGTGILEGDAAQGLPASLAATLAQVEAAAGDLRTITARVAASDAVPSLLAALERTGAITADIQSSAEAFPAMVDELDRLIASANALPLASLAGRADALLNGLQDVVDNPATGALPRQLGSALDELGAAVADVRVVTGEVVQSGAVASLTAALQRADSIARSVDTASAGLPDLLARIDAIAREAETLPLSELVASANALVVSAEALVASDDTAQIPAALAEALHELGATLGELRDGGVVENANTALASASQAADAIAEAAANLPELAQRLDGLVSQSEALLASYGGRSEFNAQTLATLRDLRDSARAVTALARTIERKPNSLLIGR